jgi:hypothetical protein
MDLLSLSRVTVDAECLRSVKPPMNFNDANYLSNAVTCTVQNGKEVKDWIGDSSIFRLWKYLITHQLVITYNGLGFDYPLWGGALYSPEDNEAKRFFEKSLKGKTVDLCLDFKEALGIRVKLGDVSVPTLGDVKEMNGGFAPDLWRDGKCFEVIEYCRGDIRRTDNLFILAASGKPLKVKLKDGQIREFFCKPKIR